MADEIEIKIPSEVCKDVMAAGSLSETLRIRIKQNIVEKTSDIESDDTETKPKTQQIQKTKTKRTTNKEKSQKPKTEMVEEGGLVVDVKNPKRKYILQGEDKH